MKIHVAALTVLLLTTCVSFAGSMSMQLVEPASPEELLAWAQQHEDQDSGRPVIERGERTLAQFSLGNPAEVSGLLSLGTWEYTVSVANVEPQLVLTSGYTSEMTLVGWLPSSSYRSSAYESSKSSQLQMISASSDTQQLLQLQARAALRQFHPELYAMYYADDQEAWDGAYLHLVVVPEPSSAAMVMVAGVCFLRRSRHRR